MASSRRRGILVALLLAAVASPAAAFSLFGIHLWGERDDEDRIEVIDPLPYTVTFRVSGGENGLQRRLEDASSLWTDRETPASGNSGLLAKARGDYRRLLAALYAEGFYGPYISIRAAGGEVADLTLDADFPPKVPVVVEVRAGPPFYFRRTEIVDAPPVVTDLRDDVEAPASVGFAPGERARSGTIDQASALAIEQWRQLARAKAREADREVLADHPADRLDVTLILDPGRQARYGPLQVEGSRRTDPGFIAFMTDLPEGRPYDPDDVAAGQARLGRLGVFRSIRIEEAEEIAPDGSLPMTVAVEDRRPRTIGFGATLSTIDGVGVTAYWLHRNLFGRAEQLRFDAGVDGLGGSLNPDDYDYNIGVTFTKPGVWTPDTNFVTSLAAQRLDLDQYRQQSITGRAGISQLFGAGLTGDLFAEISRARFEDAFGVRHFTTYALVGRGQYDRRDDPLDPTRGNFVAAEVRPFYEAVFGNAAVRGTLEGRAYLGFGPEDRTVLAGRAKIGSYWGPSIAESPPDLLFFSGGGGSVRGYAYRSIGVETFDLGDDESFVVGGRGLLETSGELRYRINDSFGAVGFVDAGFVTEDPKLSGDSDLRIGAGLGLRYFTGFGPLRFDLATPIDRRPEDSLVALYIGIGQAF